MHIFTIFPLMFLLDGVTDVPNLAAIARSGCCMGVALVLPMHGSANTGYQGIQKFHNKSDLPKKNRKKCPLTKSDKQHNQVLSRSRVAHENVIGMLKRFKSISGNYRNRRKRFGLRCNLIAGMYNWEPK